MRVATEAKYTEKQRQVIDVHDLLHSIFWGKPTRDELKVVMARMNAELASQRVSQMEREIDELAEMDMTKLERRN
jgi:hypothetical protein